MGSIHARENQNETAWTTKSKTSSINANVVAIHVNGLSRTKDEWILEALRGTTKAHNLDELLHKAHDGYSRLTKIGCFRKVECIIDTSKSGGPNDYEIIYNVQEVGPFKGQGNVMVGNQEGGFHSKLYMPNLFGRSEKLSIDYDIGHKKTTSVCGRFEKPLLNFPLISSFSSSIYQQSMAFPTSGAYEQTDRGTNVAVTLRPWSSLNIINNISAEAVWRELSCGDDCKNFEVRENMGNSLKISLQHQIGVDRRDDCILPSSGWMFRLKHEVAGLGDVSFYRGDAKAQHNISMPFFSGDITLQTSVNTGILYSSNSLGNSPKDYPCDRFFLGGPSNVRGFEDRGIKPVLLSGARSLLGGRSYWAVGSHVFMPLPFKPSMLGDAIRTHAWINFGNVNSGHNLDGLIKNVRVSIGCGIALRFAAMARVELNYCLPLLHCSGDQVTPGLQFGVDAEFL